MFLILESTFTFFQNMRNFVISIPYSIQWLETAM